jgi:N-acylglucosamine-6-phosphate 2-epimerase
MKDIFKQRGLIVSCQALPSEPLHSSFIMGRMALAAQQSGAIGIRANSAVDIAEIKRVVDLPVIGLIKREIPGSDIYITPTLDEVKAILDAGAEIVALDMTDREGRYDIVKPMIEYVHNAGAYVMADISTFEEGIKSEELGADLISTTMSGYTPYSPSQEGPDYELIKKLAQRVSVPVVAEGRIWSPQEAVTALDAGAKYVVVGGAITRPQLITKKYVTEINKWLDI